MLRDRPDAAELQELLDFHPPDWRRYYDTLWSRYPTLAADWVHVGFLNLPTTSAPDEDEWQWEQDREARRRQVYEQRVHRDQLILAEVRAKVLGLMAKRGAERARAQRVLDRRLDELGLRPLFPGGTHIPKSERPAMKKRYQELRHLIDKLRSTSAEADTANAKYRQALLIRFPLFSERDVEAIFRYPYPRRGATADAAMAVLARRFQTTPATLDRYLFPR